MPDDEHYSDEYLVIEIVGADAGIWEHDPPRLLRWSGDDLSAAICMGFSETRSDVIERSRRA